MNSYVQSRPPVRKASIRAEQKGPEKQPVEEPTVDPQACLAQSVTPPCLRKAYGLESYFGNNTSNAQAVIVNQGYRNSDLALFTSKYGLPAQKIVKDIGIDPATAGDEATLDTQYIIAAGSQVPTWWVWLDGHGT
jgi:hypothetical protein